MATFEDLLSGKGISYIYGFLCQDYDHNYSNEDILNNVTDDAFCDETKILLIKILAIFAKYTALITGSSGGVYLAGSLSKSLLRIMIFQNLGIFLKKVKRWISIYQIFLFS